MLLSYLVVSFTAFCWWEPFQLLPFLISVVYNYCCCFKYLYLRCFVFLVFLYLVLHVWHENCTRLLKVDLCEVQCAYHCYCCTSQAVYIPTINSSHSTVNVCSNPGRDNTEDNDWFVTKLTFNPGSSIQMHFVNDVIFHLPSCGLFTTLDQYFWNTNEYLVQHYYMLQHYWAESLTLYKTNQTKISPSQIYDEAFRLI